MTSKDHSMTDGELDRLLDSLVPPEPSDTLRARLHRAVDRRVETAGPSVRIARPRPTMRRGTLASGLAAAILVLAVGVGILNQPVGRESDMADARAGAEAPALDRAEISADRPSLTAATFILVGDDRYAEPATIALVDPHFIGPSAPGSEPMRAEPLERMPLE